ncbi:MAG: hypothetical protein HY860_02370 [Chlamydiales bacterium]|nr:hypothetical protein [Chlamydiales bacterium]
MIYLGKTSPLSSQMDIENEDVVEKPSSKGVTAKVAGFVASMVKLFKPKIGYSPVRQQVSISDDNEDATRSLFE